MEVSEEMALIDIEQGLMEDSRRLKGKHGTKQIGLEAADLEIVMEVKHHRRYDKLEETCSLLELLSWRILLENQPPNQRQIKKYKSIKISSRLKGWEVLS